MRNAYTNPLYRDIDGTREPGTILGAEIAEEASSSRQI